MTIWVWSLIVTVVFSLFRCLSLWVALQDMLRVFTSLPLLKAYGRVPPALSRTFGRYLGQFRLTRLGVSIPVQQWIEVARGFDTHAVAVARIMFRKELSELSDDEGMCFTNIERAIKGIDLSERTWGESVLENRRLVPLISAAQAAQDIQANFLKESFGAKESDSDEVADSPTFQGVARPQ